MSEQAAPQCYRHPGRATWITCQRCGRPICPDCMVPAAVGFQCPECVNEGRKTVRAPRTMLGGRISANPQQTTIILIAINVFLWVLTTATGGDSSKIFRALALTPQGNCAPDSGSGWFAVSKATCQSIPGTHWVSGALNGAPWQVLTSAFMHVEPAHIAVNMLSLWFVGPLVEQAFGRARFLTIYFVAMLTGSVGVLLFSDPHTPTLGASGAIFGLLGALLVLYRHTPPMLSQIVFWLVLNLVFTFAVPGISWQDHVGGLIGGALATLFIQQLHQNRRATPRL